MKPVSLLPLAALLLAACIGEIGDAGKSAGAAAAPSGRSDTAGDTSISALCSTTYAPGHVPIHRLTNAEYNNTVRNLLFTTKRPGDAFTPTAPGLSGFANDSDALPISDENVASYYAAAESLADELVATKGAPTAPTAGS